MATYCPHCGEELPRDDARFCNNCGAPRPTRLVNSPSFAGTDNTHSSGVTPPEHAQSKGLIEQASPQPPLRMKPRPDIEQPPSWIRHLQRESPEEQTSKDERQQMPASQEQEGKPQDVLARNEQQERLAPQQPEPVMHTTVMERRSTQSRDVASPEQLDFPELPSTPQSFSPVLRVKVWSEADPEHSLHGLGEDVVRQEDATLALPGSKQPMEANTQEGHAVEDQPTRSMESMQRPSQASFSVDDIPTTPLLVLPSEQVQPAPGQNKYVPPQPNPDQVPADVTDVSHVSTVHLQAQPQRQTPLPPSVTSRSDHPVAPANIPVLTTRTRKRLPLIVGSAAVLLLLALALGSWIIILQPFRVSPVTETQQSFTDAKLGVSLRYPSGWKTPQVDYGKQTITLQDGSDTAQMNVNIADASAASPQSYLQKQAAQLGISNPKSGASSSFAGSSWQSIQGDTQVRGAQYTYGLFTTLHNNHLYTLTQLAPSSIYTDEEKLVFAPTRLSFHFL